MRMIYRPRGEGKTTELIKISAEKQQYIVCINQMECSRIFSQARLMGLDIPFPITFDEFIKREYYGKGIKGFLIDNADQLLQYMSSVPVEAITVCQGL